jgi:hypothetical protein
VLEVGATGTFDVGPGAATFLRGLGRVEGCPVSLRPTRWLSIAPCIGVEAGALRGAGVVQGSLVTTDAATVPWAAASLLPAAIADLGRVRLTAQGGPVFPFVRRTFRFERPEYLVHELPAATSTAGVGVAVTFP